MEKKTLKQWREESGKLQREVAAEIGGTQTSIWRWESSPEALQSASYKTLKKLGKAVGCEPFQFDFGDSEEDAKDV